MGIQNVIKYEGDNQTLVYKYPDEDFNTLSQLIVHESQEAVFFSDGRALDSFKAGRYTLETKNIPLISKLRNIISDGVSPFHCEVYFINLATMMDISWGTPSQVTVKDPVYGYSYSVGASGSFGIKIVDGRNLLINVVGTEEEMTTEHLQKYFKDLIVTRVKNYIAIELSKYSYNTFNQQLNEISENVSAQIKQGLADFGIDIFNFFVSAISINPDDLETLKSLDNNMALKRFEALGNRDARVIEAEGLAKSREIQGYTWQQEQQFDVSKTFAQNEGFAANPANMMAQIPLAFTMGNMMNENVKQSYQDMNPNGIHKTCTYCGQIISEDAKFCPGCGEKVIIAAQNLYCSECGGQMEVTARFCPHCGARRNEI